LHGEERMNIIRKRAMTTGVGIRVLTIAMILMLGVVLIGCSSTKSGPSLSILREGDVVTKMADDDNYLYSVNEPRYVNRESKKVLFGLKLQMEL
jgi:hypothetical protein